MPLKWNIYHACSWYNLMFLLAFAGTILYFDVSGSRSFYKVYNDAFSILALLLVATKPFLSIRFLGHLVHQKKCGHTERVLFIIGFSLNILFLICVIAWLVYVGTLSNGFSNFNQLPPVRLWILLSFFLVTVTMLFTVIFDFPLLNYIRRQRYEMINDIGAGIE